MSTRRKKPGGDPRKAGGTIAGPGGPRDRNGVIIDATDAVLLSGIDVALMEGYRTGESTGLGFAMALAGRINKTPERVEILYLLGEDALAGLVTELLAVASRAGADLTDRVITLLEERLADLARKDALRPVAPEGSP